MTNGDKPKSGEGSFAQMIGNVRRLTHDSVEFSPPRPPPRRLRHAADEDAEVNDPFSEFDDANDAEEYHRSGVQHSILRKLRRGQFPIEAEVDLHGLTTIQARARLNEFLNYARSARTACVRVIHGKGLSSPGLSPVLKPRVQHWLRHDERVLAFVPAPRHDGGSGAKYVLLRSRSR